MILLYEMIKDKFERLKIILKEMGSVLVAYSGGVDSTLLLKVARDVLGDKVASATAVSATYPKEEYLQAKSMAERLGVKHVTVKTRELEAEGFSNNSPQRCYYCKKELIARLKQIAEREGLSWIVDGSNLDDVDDFRPGEVACKEMGVRSPLKESGLSKEDIRSLSREMKLPTWDKPSMACLASRFPYGDKITLEKLQMVGEAEKFLKSLGARQVRLRHHGDVARIEVGREDMGKFFDEAFRKKVARRLKGIGYRYVSLDLEGYRTGSMNPVRSKSPKATAAPSVRILTG